jgi:hypothetical protein
VIQLSKEISRLTVVDDSGGGIGKEKHEKFYKYIDFWKLDQLELVLERFEAREFRQGLTHVYRNLNGMYFIVQTTVDYNRYLNFLDWQRGDLQPQEGETEEDVKDAIDYETDVDTFHLPIDIVKVLAGNAIDWLLSKIPPDEPGIDYTDGDGDLYVYRG